MSRYGASKDSVNQLRLPNLTEPYHNQDLFADHFLADRLLQLPEWRSAGNIQNALQAIWELYNERAAKFTVRTNEAQTERNFIRPVLDILWCENQGGDCYQVQSGISTLDAHRRPDYAFFCTAKERDDSEKQLGALEYWLDVPVLGDAKRWSASLDKERGVDDNPSAQICRYLYRSRVRWGILTNGRIRRLYRESPRKHPYLWG